MLIPASGVLGTPAASLSVSPSSSNVITKNQVASATLTASVSGGAAPYSFMWISTDDDSTFSAPSSLTTNTQMIEGSQNQTFHFELIVTDVNNATGSGLLNIAISFPSVPI